MIFLFSSIPRNVTKSRTWPIGPLAICKKLHRQHVLGIYSSMKIKEKNHADYQEHGEYEKHGKPPEHVEEGSGMR